MDILEVMFVLKVVSWGLGFGRVGFEGLPLSCGMRGIHVESCRQLWADGGCWQVWLGFACGVESGLGICIRGVHIVSCPLLGLGGWC